MSVDDDRILELSKALSKHALGLRMQIENYQAKIVFRSSIKSVLLKLEQELSKEILDTKELNRCAYSIGDRELGAGNQYFRKRIADLRQ